jgi:hypothetical protein
MSRQLDQLDGFLAGDLRKREEWKKELLDNDIGSVEDLQLISRSEDWKEFLANIKTPWPWYPFCSTMSLKKVTVDTSTFSLDSMAGIESQTAKLLHQSFLKSRNAVLLGVSGCGKTYAIGTYAKSRPFCLEIWSEYKDEKIFRNKCLDLFCHF